MAAEILIDEGVGIRIDAKQIPNEVRWNQFGTPARFAILLPKSSVPRFDQLIADLRMSEPDGYEERTHEQQQQTWALLDAEAREDSRSDEDFDRAEDLSWD